MIVQSFIAGARAANALRESRRTQGIPARDSQRSPFLFSIRNLGAVPIGPALGRYEENARLALVSRTWSGARVVGAKLSHHPAQHFQPGRRPRSRVAAHFHR